MSTKTNLYMKKTIIITSLIFVALFLLTVPFSSSVLAFETVDRYSPLVGLPGVDPNTSDFSAFVNALYALSISIAALLAVIKIVIAGVKWMLTDIVPAKSEAKKDIQGALTGLIIVLSAVLILTVINSNLVDVKMSIDKLDGTEKGVENRDEVADRASLTGTPPDPWDAGTPSAEVEPNIKWLALCKKAGGKPSSQAVGGPSGTIVYTCS